MDLLYTAVATARGGREGEVVSDDGVLDLTLAPPTELGGPGGDQTNPEQLFAAGYAACFHSALKMVAGKQKVAFTDSAVTADVGIGPNDAGGFGLEITLSVELGGIDQAAAEQLVEADLGSEDAAFVVDQAEGHELQWYATQEIGPLLELG